MLGRLRVEISPQKGPEGRRGHRGLSYLPKTCHTSGITFPWLVGPGVTLDIHSMFKRYLLQAYSNNHPGSNKILEITADTY